MKGLFRTYWLVSLAVVVLAGAAMFAHHRAVLIQSVEAIAETNSVTTGRLAFYPIRDQLVEYIESANRPDADPAAIPVTPRLRESIFDLLRDSRVVRVKIYNRNGRVVFSTLREQIGGHQEANAGFSTAMAGRVAVELIYRDTFNAFDRSTEEDNLVQTYFPVRSASGDRVIGVLEIYSDVNALVFEAQRSQWRILAGTVLAIGCIYAALLLLVFRLQREIEAQQRIIAQKNAQLERYSLESVRREESDRKKFARELHEGLAQSLSAVKIALENIRGGESRRRSDELGAIIPHLQQAIGQAREIADDLHPPGLEAFGLGATVDALLEEFARRHPEIAVNRDIGIEEDAISVSLKGAVYRTVETLLDAVAGRTDASRLHLSLRTEGDELTLVFGDDARVFEPQGAAIDPRTLPAHLGERVLMSKGRLSLVAGDEGVTALRAAWQL